jgi:hypothetical protein
MSYEVFMKLVESAEKGTFDKLSHDDDISKKQLSADDYWHMFNRADDAKMDMNFNEFKMGYRHADPKSSDKEIKEAFS